MTRHANRPIVRSRIASVLAGLAALLPAIAAADGFAELKAALARQQGDAPLKGQVKIETYSRQGEGKDTDAEQGQATLSFDDSPLGLRVFYARETLARLELEERARTKDPNARAPTVAALKAFEPQDLHHLLSPVPGLLEALDECAPKSEIEESWNGRPARRLSCQTSIAKLKGKDRKYVKKFEGALDVWIAADGTPLASKERTALSGRALVVIGFEATSEVELSFQLIANRLVALRQERRDSGSGAGEKGESRTVYTLNLPP